ncbi:YncE family protein [Nocardia sp. NBC_01009]|uniref:YncE family protein n=1 Tax=Nocardia sp. NBC_01009 TaxID=2975996 RepID=UPI00386775CB|nr:hypothetical protein OHA42_30445 [Nocardia sp. NBC_01009]
MPGSESLAPSADGALLFVATPVMGIPPDPAASYAVQVIDVGTDAVVDTISALAAPCPVHVTANSLLVGQWRFGDVGSPLRAGLLSIYDAISFAPLDRIEVGAGPINIVSTPDGALGFVSNLQSGTVSVVDIDNAAVTATLEVDRGNDLPLDRSIPNQNAHGMAYIPAVA